MQRVSFEDMNCSVAECLEVVGEWWSLLIVRSLRPLGVRRFDDFQALVLHLPQHPQPASEEAGRQRRPRACAVPGQPAAIGVSAHGEGSRPLARSYCDA